ncbi:MAG TPA: hypothetical protein VED84_01690 [Acidimicrobiales bacterium]|nr:hypothetical protein [Acidimicrobiales bacterium]
MVAVNGARVALATCAGLPDLGEDGPAMTEALAARGVTATPEVWDAPEVDWSRFDLVVIRGTWDYTERRDEFLAWARSVARLANPYSVIEWNTDKTYLADLAAAGVATIPTTWCHPGSAVRLPAGEIVVKPSVGAGTRDCGRYGPRDRERALGHVERLLRAGRTVLVQPYLGAFEGSGERGLVYLGNRYSHTIAKPARLGQRGPYVDGTPAGEVVATTPTASERAFAEKVLAAIPAGRENLLYARVDLVTDAAGKPALVEAELTEPLLFLDCEPRSPALFAQAVTAWLARF